jgi:non-lysosomal glucosylceramidase
MTGFEYSTAAHMIYEGMVADGLKCIQAVRDRYDGRKRSPFDEAECGHHYARAMASWAAVLALTGFRYSGVTGSMAFACKPGRSFWSNGYAWGTCAQTCIERGVRVRLHVLHGELSLSRLEIGDVGCLVLEAPEILSKGDSREWVIR